MSKIRKSAMGQDCQLNIYPYCNGNPETTVLCHAPSIYKGMSLKSPDHWGSYGCSDCHDIIDGRRQIPLSKLEILECVMRGVFSTQQLLIDQGLMVIK